MIRAALIALLLTGCASTPRIVTQIEVIEVPVRQWVPLAAGLTDCGWPPDWPQRPLTGEDVDRWILGATAELQRCRRLMAEIRQLQKVMP